MSPIPQDQLEPCPLLPIPDKPITAKDSKALEGDRGEAFYGLCLKYAQTKWRAGLPAQSLLQLNRAMSADISGGEAILQSYPIPYRPVVWMLEFRPDREGFFFGNPRRHWQHYASRMSGPRSTLRIWRAWACWALAVSRLPDEGFPADEKQIREEGLQLPTKAEIAEALREFGHSGEVELWMDVLGEGN